MLSAFELSQFSKQWTNVPEEVFIRGGLALIAIGTTGYILNKIFNSSPAENSSEERPATQSMLTNRPYSAVVKEHLRATYAHFAGGLVMTGSFAYLFHRARWSTQLMTENKWISVSGILFFSFGSSFTTKMIDQHRRPVLKYTAWALFNSSLGLSLSPLFFLDSYLLAHAVLLSAGVVISISAVSMTTRREQYLWLGAPLMAGLSVAFLASISPIILPDTTIRTLPILEYISVYGGLAIFSGILLFDTQKMISNAETAQNVRTLSSIDESIDIYLDTINIFIRILALLSNNDKSKKKWSTSTSGTKEYQVAHYRQWIEQ